MRFAFRYCGPVIVTALLLAHAGIAVHAAAHLATDAGDCKVCTTYHPSAVAIDSGSEPASLIQSSTPLLPPGGMQLRLISPRTFNSRAPPSPIG